MDDTYTKVVVPTPILGLLGIAFVVLKLTGIIKWSWWWVLLPFYGPFALVMVFLAIIFLIAFIQQILKMLL